MTMPNLNQGALAPVQHEVIDDALKVTGEIPRALHGSLVRNGPNPFSGRFAGDDVLSWWPEAAMLHAVSFADGQALAYRNRWVRTQNWANYHDIDASDQWLDSNPNVNVISHAGRSLALAEGGVPVQFDHHLDTLGASSAHPGFAKGLTAHPKIDPLTQELFAFRADWSEPWLRYCVFSAEGGVMLDAEIDVPAPAMMHDMALSERYSILFDLNVGYDFSMFERGYRIPICWQDSRESRLGVVPRYGGDVMWFAIQACFIQHVVNAYEAHDTHLIVDVARYPWYFKAETSGDGFAANPLAVLWRYTLNLKDGTVSETQLSDLHVELPRINDAYTGRMNRYAYGVEQPTNEEMRGIFRYDFQSYTMQHHAIDVGDQNSEPVFVARDAGAAEDDGWLLVCVYRQASDTTDIRILDAQDLSADPLAIIELAHRIPAGFHGAWIAAS